MTNRFHSRPLRLIWVLGLALLIASTAGAIFAVHSGSEDKPKDKPADAKVLEVPKEGLVAYGFVDVEGGIISLYPAQPGRVAKVLVRENKTVDAKGTPLLELDDRLAKDRVAEAQADLAAARDQLKLAEMQPLQQVIRKKQQAEAVKAIESDIAAARSGLARKRNLYEAKQAPIQEVQIAEQLVEKLNASLRAENEKAEELKLADEQIKLQINRAEQEVKAREARAAQADLALKECVLKSPEAGEVLQVTVGEGSMVGAGPPASPAIMFAPSAKIKPRVVRAEVEQEFANRLAIDRPVKIHDESTNRQTWSGKITRVANWYTQRRFFTQPLAAPIPNDVYTLECVIGLDPDQPPLRLGQRVRVVIGKN